MVMTFDKETPSLVLKKWMSKFSKRIETYTSSEKGVKKFGSLKTSIRKPMKEDYKNLPDHYVLGRPLLRGGLNSF
jgi:hypothetical protein